MREHGGIFMLGGYHREIWQEPMNEVDMENIVFPMFKSRKPTFGKIVQISSMGYFY